MALWLDLIPKINKKTGTGTQHGSTDHMLSNSYNLSSFDDPGGLITDQKYHRLFPVNPPLHTTTQKPYQNDVHVTQQPVGGNYLHSSTLKVTYSDESTDSTKDITTESGAMAKEMTHDSLVNSSVPLSITVAIGCSLLFINILIYAGVYYQRERIKKLKQSEKANTARNQGQNNEPKNSDTNTVNHISTNPNIKRDADNLMYSVAIKQSDIPDKKSYTQVPTKSDSPIHRQRVKHPPANSITTSGRGGNSLYHSVGVPSDRSPAGSDRSINRQYHSSGPKSDNPITVV